MTGNMERGRHHDDILDRVTDTTVSSSNDTFSTGIPAPGVGRGGFQVCPVFVNTTYFTPDGSATLELDVRRIVKLTASMHHCFAVLDDDSVWRWGWGLQAVPVEELGMLSVRDLACGFAHMLVLAADPNPDAPARSDKLTCKGQQALVL